MPANPYTQIAADLTTEESTILDSWGFAETELNSQSANPTIFLELQYDGSKINRAFDSVQVVSLPESEQLRLYSQLGGLFNLAMRNKLYP